VNVEFVATLNRVKTTLFKINQSGDQSIYQ